MSILLKQWATGIAGGQSWSSYCTPLYYDVWEAMTVKPSREIGILQNTFIKTLVDAEIFPSKVARLFLTGAHSIGETVIDFVDPTRKATFVNQPTFTANKGIIGYGTISGCLDLEFNPASETDKYTQNDAGFGVYLQNNVNGTFSDFGASDGTHISFLNARNAGVINCCLNENASTANTGINNADSSGFYFVTRRGANGATKKYFYKNKVETELTANSTGVPNRNLLGMALFFGGSTIQHSQRQNGLIIITSGLTTIEEGILSDAVNAYFTGVAAATWPYITAGNTYEGYGITNPNTKLYFDGSTLYPIIGANHAKVTAGVTLGGAALGLSSVRGSFSLAAGTDKIEFTNNSIFNFDFTDRWAVEFMINYSTIGSIITRVADGMGWTILINETNRLEAWITYSVGDDKYIVQQTKDQLTTNVNHHVLVQFYPSMPNTLIAPRIIITIDGKEQVTYPQYEAKARRGLTDHIWNVGTLMIGSGLVASMSDLAIYADLGNAKNIQQRCWMQMYSWALPTWTKPLTKMNVILDQDMDTDPDDLGDLHCGLALDGLGEITLLGEVCSTGSEMVAPCAQAVADWWDRPTLPIGQYQGNEGRIIPTDTDTVCYSNLRDQFKPGDTRTNYPSDVTTYRMLLAAAANNSVVIIATGYMISLYNLMVSEADGISPLTGLELISQKVNTLFVGDYNHPSGTLNPALYTTYNGTGHAASWKYVLENFSKPIIFFGMEFSWLVSKGSPVLDPDDFLTNPVRYGFKYDPLNNNIRPVSGAFALVAAARGLSNYYILSYPFDLTIDGTTALSSDVVYSQTGRMRFMRFADNYGAVQDGNLLTTYLDTLFALTKDTV